MKILIIKTAARGDVIRTTPLLRVLSGEIYWLTSREGKELLVGQPKLIKKIVTEDEVHLLAGIPFDLILSLEEDAALCRAVESLTYNKLVGIYWDKKGECMRYTKDSSALYDMSLISRHGREKADAIKLKSRKTYQEKLFAVIGREFKGEEYAMDIRASKKKKRSGPIVIAIEKRAGARWPMKQWHAYDALRKRLKKEGYKTFLLRQRVSMRDYMHDIHRADIVISGDTLGMHLALALGKQLVTIFTCTAPWEIYDYGRMTKVVSPLLHEGFYRRDYIKEIVEAVTVDDVFKAVLQRASLVKSSK